MPRLRQAVAHPPCQHGLAAGLRVLNQRIAVPEYLDEMEVLKTFPILWLYVFEQDDLKFFAQAVRMRNEMVEQPEGGMDLGNVAVVNIPILLIGLLILRAAVLIISPIWPGKLIDDEKWRHMLPAICHNDLVQSEEKKQMKEHVV